MIKGDSLFRLKLSRYDWPVKCHDCGKRLENGRYVHSKETHRIHRRIRCLDCAVSLAIVSADDIIEKVRNDVVREMQHQTVVVTN